MDIISVIYSLAGGGIARAGKFAWNEGAHL